MSNGKHDEIADSLTNDILVGQYRMGERLPSERDLSARFDASRGAVREAMKKLEQLGIADIQPGGARVLPVNEASLDVIGCLLSLEDAPNFELIEQILVVLHSLVKTAAEQAVNKANDEQMQMLRAQVRPLHADDLHPDAYMEARTAMMHGFMVASGNLPVQLIASSLRMQFPQVKPEQDYSDFDFQTHRKLARQLDEALDARDISRVREVFDAFFELNMQYVQQSIRVYEQALQSPAQEAVTS